MPNKYKTPVNVEDVDQPKREASLAAPLGYAVVGKRIKDGKEEMFRSPKNHAHWYRVPVAETMLKVMRAGHPSWTFELQIEPHNTEVSGGEPLTHDKTKADTRHPLD